ncbi:LytR/AlgR family response regulator transcription factor [Runella salmonicolor]|uniref:LytTR family transcriptional regulator DNA-binding domain-containing protein n=1 Tax=Runella salmonicolor TaxID=2950278 RepID=A0ABT1FL18_9BACT|nr:LytTR family DNA-binding domain-containing protein [Runella salmonicolor]MCP1382456.1 LytTR family transcriptional regulator DNA-binding domain-containing protein [Runella salmonicolor]
MSQPQLFSLPQLEENPIHRLCIHIGGLVRTIDIQSIMYLQSEVNYTRFFAKDGKTYLEAKTLKHFDKVLEDTEFIRIHKSYLVNRNCIVSMTSDFVLLKNGVQLPVSRRKGRALKRNRNVVSLFSKLRERRTWY